jgi:hypothetical protein
MLLFADPNPTPVTFSFLLNIKFLRHFDSQSAKLAQRLRSEARQRAAFRVLRHDPQHSDVTRRETGTHYTLFFGSVYPMIVEL